MFKYLKDILEGFWSLVVGMNITMRYAFKKPVTVIYPKERIPMKRFKGPIAFVIDKKNDDHLCIDVCPTDALKHDDPNYDMVSLTQRELIMDLLEPFEKRGTPLTKIPVLAPGQAAPAPAAKPAPTTTPETAK